MVIFLIIMGLFGAIFVPKMTEMFGNEVASVLLVICCIIAVLIYGVVSKRRRQ